MCECPDTKGGVFWDSGRAIVNFHRVGWSFGYASKVGLQNECSECVVVALRCGLDVPVSVLDTYGLIAALVIMSKVQMTRGIK